MRDQVARVKGEGWDYLKLISYAGAQVGERYADVMAWKHFTLEWNIQKAADDVFLGMRYDAPVWAMPMPLELVQTSVSFRHWTEGTVSAMANQSHNVTVVAKRYLVVGRSDQMAVNPKSHKFEGPWYQPYFGRQLVDR